MTTCERCKKQIRNKEVELWEDDTKAMPLCSACFDQRWFLIVSDLSITENCLGMVRYRYGEKKDNG